MGTNQLPAFPLGPQHQVISEKGLAEIALSAGKALNKPEESHPSLWVILFPADLSLSQVMQLLPFSLARGT